MIIYKKGILNRFLIISFFQSFYIHKFEIMKDYELLIFESFF